MSASPASVTAEPFESTHDSLSNLSCYLPRIVLTHLAQASSVEYHTQPGHGATLFFDISGWTKLADSYAQQADGAEQISNHLNSYFTSILAVADRFGGDVMSFSGDALLFVWLAEDETDESSVAVAVQKAVLCAVALLQQSPPAAVPLAAHIGIGTGAFFTMYVGLGVQWRWVTMGPAVQQATRACTLASSGELVLSSHAFAHARDICHCMDVESGAVSNPLSGMVSQPRASDLIGAGSFLRFTGLVGETSMIRQSTESGRQSTNPISCVASLPSLAKRSESLAPVMSLPARNPLAGGCNSVGPRAQTLSISVDDTARGIDDDGDGGHVSSNCGGSPVSPLRLLSRLKHPSHPSTSSLLSPSAANDPAFIDRVRRFLFDLIWRSPRDCEGQLRTVSTVFVRLAGSFDEALQNGIDNLRQALQTTFDMLQKFDGVCNKIVHDDKGLVVLCVFGLPFHSFPDDAQRAVTFAPALCGSLERILGKVQVGITRSRVFCGNVGSITRREYSIIGEGVNLAARLMAHSCSTQSLAVESQILCDESAFSACEGSCSLSGPVFGPPLPISLKGFSKSMICYPVVKPPRGTRSSRSSRSSSTSSRGGRPHSGMKRRATASELDIMGHCSAAMLGAIPRVRTTDNSDFIFQSEDDCDFPTLHAMTTGMALDTAQESGAVSARSVGSSRSASSSIHTALNQMGMMGPNSSPAHSPTSGRRMPQSPELSPTRKCEKQSPRRLSRADFSRRPSATLRRRLTVGVAPNPNSPAVVAVATSSDALDQMVPNAGLLTHHAHNHRCGVVGRDSVLAAIATMVQNLAEDDLLQQHTEHHESPTLSPTTCPQLQSQPPRSATPTRTSRPNRPTTPQSGRDRGRAGPKPSRSPRAVSPVLSPLALTSAVNFPPLDTNHPTKDEDNASPPPVGSSNEAILASDSQELLLRPNPGPSTDTSPSFEPTAGMTSASHLIPAEGPIGSAGGGGTLRVQLPSFSSMAASESAATMGHPSSSSVAAPPTSFAEPHKKRPEEPTLMVSVGPTSTSSTSFTAMKRTILIKGEAETGKTTLLNCACFMCDEMGIEWLMIAGETAGCGLRLIVLELLADIFDPYLVTADGETSFGQNADDSNFQETSFSQFPPRIPSACSSVVSPAISVTRTPSQRMDALRAIIAHISIEDRKLLPLLIPMIPELELHLVKILGKSMTAEGSLLGVSKEGQPPCSRVYAAVRALVLAVYHAHPLLIMVDDAHKLDSMTSEFLAYLVNSVPSVGLVLAGRAPANTVGKGGMPTPEKRRTASSDFSDINPSTPNTEQSLILPAAVSVCSSLSPNMESVAWCEVFSPSSRSVVLPASAATVTGPNSTMSANSVNNNSQGKDAPTMGGAASQNVSSVERPPQAIQAQLFDLEPLSRAHSGSLCCHILGVGHVHPSLVEFVHDKSDGTPGLARQLLLALQDTSLITIEEGMAGLIPGAESTPEYVKAVTASVEQTAMARVERLPHSQVHLLKIASVVSHAFLPTLLCRVVDSSGQDASTVVPDIQTLLQQGFLQIDESKGATSRNRRSVGLEASLRSGGGSTAALNASMAALAQRCISPTCAAATTPGMASILSEPVRLCSLYNSLYNTILFRERRDLHAMIAQCLEEDSIPNVSRIAYHYARSDDSSKAVHYLTLASEDAFQRQAFGECRTLLNSIQKLLEMEGTTAISENHEIRYRFLRASCCYQLEETHPFFCAAEDALRLLGAPISFSHNSSTNDPTHTTCLPIKQSLKCLWLQWSRRLFHRRAPSPSRVFGASTSSSGPAATSSPSHHHTTSPPMAASSPASALPLHMSPTRSPRSKKRPVPKDPLSPSHRSSGSETETNQVELAVMRCKLFCMLADVAYRVQDVPLFKLVVLMGARQADQLVRLNCNTTQLQRKQPPKSLSSSARIIASAMHCYGWLAVASDLSVCPGDPASYLALVNPHRVPSAYVLRLHFIQGLFYVSHRLSEWEELPRILPICEAEQSMFARGVIELAILHRALSGQLLEALSLAETAAERARSMAAVGGQQQRPMRARMHLLTVLVGYYWLRDSSYADLLPRVQQWNDSGAYPCAYQLLAKALLLFDELIQQRADETAAGAGTGAGNSQNSPGLGPRQPSQTRQTSSFGPSRPPAHSATLSPIGTGPFRAFRNSTISLGQGRGWVYEPSVLTLPPKSQQLATIIFCLGLSVLADVVTELDSQAQADSKQTQHWKRPPDYLVLLKRMGKRLPFVEPMAWLWEGQWWASWARTRNRKQPDSHLDATTDITKAISLWRRVVERADRLRMPIMVAQALHLLGTHLNLVPSASSTVERIMIHSLKEHHPSTENDTGGGGVVLLTATDCRAKATQIFMSLNAIGRVQETNHGPINGVGVGFSQFMGAEQHSPKLQPATDDTAPTSLFARPQSAF